MFTVVAAVPVLGTTMLLGLVALGVVQVRMEPRLRLVEHGQRLRPKLAVTAFITT